MNETAITLSYTLLPGNVFKATAEVNLLSADPDTQYHLRLFLKDKTSSSIVMEDTFISTLPMTAEWEYPQFDNYARHGGQLVLEAILSAKVISPVTQHLDITYYGYEKLFDTSSYSYHFSCLFTSDKGNAAQFDNITFCLSPKDDCDLLEDPTLQFSYINDQGESTVCEMTLDPTGPTFELKDSLSDADYSGGQGHFTWQCHVTYTKKGEKDHRESAFITLQTDGTKE